MHQVPALLAHRVPCKNMLSLKVIAVAFAKPGKPLCRRVLPVFSVHQANTRIKARRRLSYAARAQLDASRHLRRSPVLHAPPHATSIYRSPLHTSVKSAMPAANMSMPPTSVQHAHKDGVYIHFMRTVSNVRTGASKTIQQPQIMMGVRRALQEGPPPRTHLRAPRVTPGVIKNCRLP